MSAPAISPGQSADGRVTPRQKWLTGPFGASLAAALVFLVAWQLAGTFGERIPGPIPVVNAAISEIERGEFFYNFAISMQRFAIGMALSIIVGVALGIAGCDSPAGQKRWRDALLMPPGMVPRGCAFAPETLVVENDAVIALAVLVVVLAWADLPEYHD